MSTVECPRCKHEHEPSYSHEDDSGSWECEECGFAFSVEIEYDPTYWSTCVEHEYGVAKRRKTMTGEVVECRFCEHCGHCEIMKYV